MIANVCNVVYLLLKNDHETNKASNMKKSKNIPKTIHYTNKQTNKKEISRTSLKISFEHDENAPQPAFILILTGSLACTLKLLDDSGQCILFGSKILNLMYHIHC